MYIGNELSSTTGSWQAPRNSPASQACVHPGPVGPRAGPFSQFRATAWKTRWLPGSWQSPAGSEVHLRGGASCGVSELVGPGALPWGNRSHRTFKQRCAGLRLF